MEGEEAQSHQVAGDKHSVGEGGCVATRKTTRCRRRQARAAGWRGDAEHDRVER